MSPQSHGRPERRGRFFSGDSPIQHPTSNLQHRPHEPRMPQETPMTTTDVRDPYLAETEHVDPEIFRLIKEEEQYQVETVRLIPSENYTSRAVMEATGSVLANKYCEGYPGKRYYEGQRNVDADRDARASSARRRCSASSTRTCSRTPARRRTSRCTSALLEPGDTIMGLSLPHGGHLTHGWTASATSKFWNAVRYEVDATTHLIDYDEVRAMALARAPAHHRRRRDGVPAPVRLRGVRRDRARGRRLLPRRHLAHRRPDRRRRAPGPGAVRRRRHDDDAQDAARPARRDDPVQGRARRGDRQGRLPRPAGRPAREHDRRRRRRAEGSGDAGVPRVRPPDRRQREGARGRAARARLRPDHRRHRQPPRS